MTTVSPSGSMVTQSGTRPCQIYVKRGDRIGKETSNTHRLIERPNVQNSL